MVTLRWPEWTLMVGLRRARADKAVTRLRDKSRRKFFFFFLGETPLSFVPLDGRVNTTDRPCPAGRGPSPSDWNTLATSLFRICAELATQDVPTPVLLGWAGTRRE